MKRLSARIPLQLIESDRVYDFGLKQSEVVAIRQALVELFLPKGSPIRSSETERPGAGPALVIAAVIATIPVNAARGWARDRDTPLSFRDDFALRPGPAHPFRVAERWRQDRH